MLLSRIISNLANKNDKIYRDNFFSGQFLAETLENVGFQNVNPLIPYNSKESIIVSGEITDDHGNSFIVKVHHCGNVLNFITHPKDMSDVDVLNSNKLSMTKVYMPKYIESKKNEAVFFGNQTQTDLLRKCKEKANAFFEELEDEFKRRNKFFLL